MEKMGSDRSGMINSGDTIILRDLGYKDRCWDERWSRSIMAQGNWTRNFAEIEKLMREKYQEIAGDIRDRRKYAFWYPCRDGEYFEI